MSSILGFVTRRLHFTLTAGWVNYANELSQLSHAALERANQHVHDNVTASQQRGCVECGYMARLIQLIFKIQQNKTTLVQLPLTTLGQETRWAYSTTPPSPSG